MDRVELAMRAHLTPEMVAFDVGANRGDYARIMASICSKVVAFEPVPELAHAIAKQSPENIVVHNRALSDKVGTSPFFIDQREGLHGMQSSMLEIGELHDRGQVVRIDVATTTLDAFTQETGEAPDFIKIDVEGWEPAVIQGAEAVISELRPVIVFEMWESHYPNYRTTFERLYRDYFMVCLTTGADAFAYYDAAPRYDVEDILCIPRPQRRRPAPLPRR